MVDHRFLFAARCYRAGTINQTLVIVTLNPRDSFRPMIIPSVMIIAGVVSQGGGVPINEQKKAPWSIKTTHDRGVLLRRPTHRDNPGTMGAVVCKQYPKHFTTRAGTVMKPSARNPSSEECIY